jgi:hypothetical protein
MFSLNVLISSFSGLYSKLFKHEGLQGGGTPGTYLHFIPGFLKQMHLKRSKHTKHLYQKSKLFFKNPSLLHKLKVHNMPFGYHQEVYMHL